MINNSIIGWIGGILMIVNVGGMLIVNVIRLIKAIKCRNVKGMCENMECKTRCMCSKYDNTKEMLEFRIEVLKKQIEMEK